MNDEELQALIDKWQDPMTFWRPENQRSADRFEALMTDFMTVARAFQQYLRQREKLEQPLAAVIPLEKQSNPPPDVFGDLTPEQRYELHCGIVMLTTIPHLAGTPYAVKGYGDSNTGEERWLPSQKALDDWQRMRVAGYSIGRDGSIKTEEALYYESIHRENDNVPPDFFTDLTDAQRLSLFNAMTMAIPAPDLDGTKYIALDDKGRPGLSSKAVRDFKLLYEAGFNIDEEGKIVQNRGRQ